MRRSQPAWLLPPCALPDERLARKPLDGRVGHRLAQELLRRSQPAWLLPPCALPDERLARKPLDGRVGHRLAQELLQRSQPAWLLPPCALPDERLARKPLDGRVGHRLAQELLRRSQPAWLLPPCALPDERLARKPLDGRVGHRLAQELLRRSQPAWLLPPRALPDERHARKPLAVRVRATDWPRSCFGGLSPPGCSLLAPCQTNAAPGNHSPSACGPPTAPGAASAVSARLAAPSSRLARRTPRQETTRRPRAGHRLPQELLRRSQPAWLLPTRRHPVESDIAPASCTGCCEACRSPRPFSRCSSRAPEASPRETPARPPP